MHIAFDVPADVWFPLRIQRPLASVICTTSSLPLNQPLIRVRKQTERSVLVIGVGVDPTVHEYSLECHNFPLISPFTSSGASTVPLVPPPIPNLSNTRTARFLSAPSWRPRSIRAWKFFAFSIAAWPSTFPVPTWL